MNKQPADEMIDQMMRTLVRESTIDDDTVNEIADSPTLWWSVQRQIAVQKAEVKAPWPPSIWRGVLLFAMPLAVAAALIVSFFVFRSAEDVNDTALINQLVLQSVPHEIKIA